MGARHKLNSAYFYGCVFSSAVVGIVARSWLMFLLTLALTVGGSLHSGGIRHRPADCPPGPGTRPPGDPVVTTPTVRTGRAASVPPGSRGPEPLPHQSGGC